MAKAKGNREKIKLVSTAKTGHFYTTEKTSVTCLKKWKSKNLIQLFVSTLSTKKQKSSNPWLVFREKPLI